MTDRSTIFDQLNDKPRQLMRRSAFAVRCRENGLDYDQIMLLDTLENAGLEPLVGGKFIGIMREGEAAGKVVA